MRMRMLCGHVVFKGPRGDRHSAPWGGLPPHSLSTSAPQASRSRGHREGLGTPPASGPQAPVSGAFCLSGLAYPLCPQPGLFPC